MNNKQRSENIMISKTKSSIYLLENKEGWEVGAGLLEAMTSEPQAYHE